MLCHFTGWGDDALGMANPLTVSDIIAEWTITATFECNVYAVTFLDHDGKALKSETVLHGSGATAPPDPECEGHAFKGWDKAFASITGPTPQTVPHGDSSEAVTAEPDTGNFCARISNRWKIVQNFVESGAQEALIDLQASYQSKKECDEMGLDAAPLRLRLIRVELETGEIEVLITSLIDGRKYSHEIFMDLYHLRWPVEVDYLYMKQRIEVGNFSGKSALSVYLSRFPCEGPGKKSYMDIGISCSKCYRRTGG